MRRACPYRGENPGPGKDALESLTTGPELENSQGQARSSNEVKGEFRFALETGPHSGHPGLSAWCHNRKSSLLSEARGLG
jgi:hypothetical protein